MEGKPDQNTTYRYDQMNNLKKVEGPESSVIVNTYASNGGIKTTVSNGATWTFQYDDRGNRTSMADPDAGTTTYVYDALGRETSRTDARNIANVTNYDYLGRVTSSASVTYTYGTSSTDQMRLKSRSYGGWTETYDYDTYGHVTHESMSNGTTITRHKYYTYDSNGQLTGKTLPGNMTYSYTYDAYGNLTGVSGAGGAVQWSLQGYTGKRTVSHTVLNGSTSYPFVKTQLLDLYGYLDSIKVVQHDNWWYQDDDYNFSPVTGNLMTVNNRMSDGEVWSFVYDNADRLTKIRENNQDIMVMAYAANGNITGKTGTGSYTYGNTAHPHQVTGVSNTDGSIILQVQDITYNSWNKVSSVWACDDDDFYSYSIGYGPDMQRVTSELHKTYQKQYEKFYWDDYEEKVVGSDTLHYYYVSGTDGLAGLHIVKTNPNAQTTSHTTKVITDHLGSIVALIDNNDYVYDVRYDVWGNREIGLPYWFDPGFDRGYTGHEHLEQIGLINMNGRMYDPLIGRFLSPDNYIQSPGNPQSYNRYSYCLNNPLKYIDPSGEIVWAPIIIGAIIGTYSGGVLANEGNFNPTMWDWQSGKTWGYMAGGMITGALSGAAGAAIASSGIPMANTLSIMGGSFTNSLGTYAYTGGQTDITMSFGFASYNFTLNSWGWLRKEGNSKLENVGYALGALSNISDLLIGFDSESVQLNTEHSDAIGHSALTQVSETDNFNSYVSVGPDPGGKWIFNPFKFKKGTNKWNNHVTDNHVFKTVVDNVNVRTIEKYGAMLNKYGVKYNLYFNSCVNNTARALTLSGVPCIGIHPFILHAQMALRNYGFRPALQSYLLTQ